jgi:hypothetical protein
MTVVLLLQIGTATALTVAGLIVSRTVLAMNRVHGDEQRFATDQRFAPEQLRR